ncbi:MAG: GAF and ANTAR domain-containing protein [Actinobacteria bacterium]|nr:GAF and ANTAR domain-containing protein [Actinomycetota bacterium]
MPDDRAEISLCEPFVQRLDVTGASITVFDNAGRQSTVCTTDATATRLDEVQFELGEGPQWSAIRTQTAVLIEDTTNPPLIEFPGFASAIAELPVRAIFALPMAIGAVSVGVVCLYRATPGPLATIELEIARALTDRASTRAVRRTLAGAADDESSPSGSVPALRREVHQATGMILVQLDTTATDAFIRLRAHAFASGRTVEDIAHDVVTRVLDFRDLP